MTKEKCKIQNFDDLEFAIFCVENIAAKVGTDGETVYRALTDDTDLLRTYIIPSRDVLHTQSKDYIVNDILNVMKNEGCQL